VSAEGMLHLFAAELTLLPLAPRNAHGEDIERRRSDEVHSCARCGNLAETALIVQAPGETSEGLPVKRWLNLCVPHFNEVRMSA
jgi:hypothetical protein